MSAPHIKNSDNPLKDERYTPAEVLQWAREKAGIDDFTLDVAACEHSFCALQCYTKEENGLDRDWFGCVWCNPPYSDIRPWVEKAWFHAAHSILSPTEAICMLLPATRTEQAWWQELVEPYRDRPDSILRVHFYPGRIKFGKHPDDTAKMTGAPFPCVLLVWRKR